MDLFQLWKVYPLQNIIVGDTSDASSSITGSLKTAGGLGVAKKAFIGNTISIGTTSANAQLQLSNSLVNRKIILHESTANDHQYYGFGVNAGILRYQIDATTSSHVFYTGTSSVSSTELMRVSGGGNLQLGTSATATARLVVSGGVQNIGSEDSCIRVISALNSAKIELQCTNALGRLY